MQRASYERVSFAVDGNTVAFTAQLWQQLATGGERFESPYDAIDRYEEMKMIAAADYGFHLFIENIDEE